MQDRYGNPVSTKSQAALAKYDEALELIRLYRGDPIAALDDAIAEDPEFGAAWAARAGLLVQQTDKAYAEETAKSLRAGAAASLNDRERLHLKAAEDSAEGRYYEGTALLARIAREHPRDLLALQYAHVGCRPCPCVVPARSGQAGRQKFSHVQRRAPDESKMTASGSGREWILIGSIYLGRGPDLFYYEELFLFAWTVYF